VEAWKELNTEKRGIGMITQEQAQNRLATMMVEVKNLREITQKGSVTWRGIRKQKRLVAAFKRDWLPGIRVFIPDADDQVTEYLSKS
jgi:hypothetical protein